MARFNNRICNDNLLIKISGKSMILLYVYKSSALSELSTEDSKLNIYSFALK